MLLGNFTNWLPDWQRQQKHRHLVYLIIHIVIGIWLLLILWIKAYSQFLYKRTQQRLQTEQYYFWSTLLDTPAFEQTQKDLTSTNFLFTSREFQQFWQILNIQIPSSLLLITEITFSEVEILLIGNTSSLQKLFLKLENTLYALNCFKHQVTQLIHSTATTQITLSFTPIKCEHYAINT